MAHGRKKWEGFKTRVEYCTDTGKVCYDKITAVTAAQCVARFGIGYKGIGKSLHRS